LRVWVPVIRITVDWRAVGRLAAIILLSLAILASAASLCGKWTGTRIGVGFVTGNSLSGYIPEGAAYVTLPLPIKPGTYVTAVTRVPDDARDATPGDFDPKLSIKWFDGQRLRSTDSGEAYSRWEYRGRVVAVLHVERLCPWLNTGAQVEATNYRPATVDQRTASVAAGLARAVELKKLGAHEVGVVYSDDKGLRLESSQPLPRVGSWLFNATAIYKVVAIEATSEKSPMGGGGSLNLVKVAGGFPVGTTGSVWWTEKGGKEELERFVETF
jgi:hypothetical protein